MSFYLKWNLEMKFILMKSDRLGSDRQLVANFISNMTYCGDENNHVKKNLTKLSN